MSGAAEVRLFRLGRLQASLRPFTSGTRTFGTVAGALRTTHVKLSPIGLQPTFRAVAIGALSVSVRRSAGAAALDPLCDLLWTANLTRRIQCARDVLRVSAVSERRSASSLCGRDQCIVDLLGAPVGRALSQAFGISGEGRPVRDGLEL